MMRSIIGTLFLWCIGILCSFGQDANITVMEYYIDTDPGFGSGTPITITPGAIQDVDINVNTTSLSIGFHQIVVRAMDENSVWGVYQSKIFYVSNSSVTSTSDVAAIEYFFDADPGFGNATPIGITQSASIDINQLISTAALSVGFHQLAIRAQDVNGVWGIQESRVFYVSASSVVTTNDIQAVEYFFDADPGFGNGTPIAITSSATLDIDAIVASSALSTGFHVLNIRAQDANNVWGMHESRSFFVSNSSVSSTNSITAVEYFFDTDPGFGSGTPISITSSTTIDIDELVTSSTLSNGPHVLVIRGRDNQGTWGIQKSKAFFVRNSDPSNPSNITAVEYFFDTDPGVGNGNAVAVTPSNTIDQDVAIPTNSLLAGSYTLGIRLQDLNGNFSETRTGDFDVVLSTETDISGFTLTEETATAVIDPANHTVQSTVLVGTDLTALNPTIDISFGASISPTGILDFTNPVMYTVTAQDGLTTQDWTITVTESLSNETDVVSFSFAEEVSSAIIDAAAHTIQSQVASGTDLTTLTPTIGLSTGATISPSGAQDFTNPFTYTVTAEDGVTTQDWVVTVTRDVSIETEILNFSLTEEVNNAVIDAVAHTIQSQVAFGTDLTALTPTISLSAGATISPTGAQDFTNPITYTVTAEDGITTQDWIVTVTEALSSETDILSFSLAEEVGSAIINAVAHTIQSQVAFGTDLTTLTPTISLSAGATISPAGAQDFTNVLTYTVTAEDGVTTQDWIVTVTEALSSETDILSFSLAEEIGSAIIDAVAHTITAEVVPGTDLTNLLPNIGVSDGAAISPAGAQNFSSPFTYTVIAEDGVTSQDWRATITTDPIITVDLLSTNVASPQLSGTIDDNNASIAIAVDGSVYSATNNLDGTWTLPAGIISPGLVDGTYDVIATATDTQSDEVTDSSVDELLVDTTVPSVTIDVLTTSIPSPELTGTIDDNNAIIEVVVSSTNYPAINNGDGTWSLSAGSISPPLVDGVYDIAVSATDDVGNVGLDNSTDELTVSQTIIAEAATDVLSSGFTANWSQGADVLTYQIDISRSSDFSSFVVGFENFETGDLMITASGLDFSTTYYYRVRFVNTSNVTSDYSNTVIVKTTVDPETLADSLALVQIYQSLRGSTLGLNWENDRLRDWIGITLSSARVTEVEMGNLGAIGEMPNPFTGDALTNGGLAQLTAMNLSDNEISGLMDFTNTSINMLDVSDNRLDFGDLEPLVPLNLTSFNYAIQSNLQFDQFVSEGDSTLVRYDTDFILAVLTGGENNAFSWFLDSNPIADNDDFNFNDSELTIRSIGIENMGTFSGSVSNASLPDLTLVIEPQIVLAVANITMEVRSAGDVIDQNVSGFLLEAIRRDRGFETLYSVRDVPGQFVFENVVLGDYLALIESDPALFVPTYYVDAFEWEQADTIELRSDQSLQVIMNPDPEDFTAADGDGTLEVIIEEDFPEDDGRVATRRRAARRKCGLKRRRSGGRTNQDEVFDLVAYGETNDNGEFEFGFLPVGVYRFFVEYPGIPLDESSTVEFEVGEQGISDTDFRLEAFASPDGIEINIERVLGVFDLFKNLLIYPNPTTNYLNIEYRFLRSDNVRVEIVNLTGSVLLKSELKRGFDHSLHLNVSDLSEGIYILRFIDKDDLENNLSYRILKK